jgi:hypothetical protein
VATGGGPAYCAEGSYEISKSVSVLEGLIELLLFLFACPDSGCSLIVFVRARSRIAIPIVGRGSR